MICAKTYLIQFIHKKGNGWAIVNANDPQQAEKLFKANTIYLITKVVSIKECRWVGNQTQLVYEGAVTSDIENPYELAVLNGYQGTLSQWLESLQGPPGPPGPPGPQGPPGKDAPELTQEDFDEICV